MRLEQTIQPRAVWADSDQKGNPVSDAPVSVIAHSAAVRHIRSAIVDYDHIIATTGAEFIRTVAVRTADTGAVHYIDSGLPQVARIADVDATDARTLLGIMPDASSTVTVIPRRTLTLEQLSLRLDTKVTPDEPGFTTFVIVGSKSHDSLPPLLLEAAALIASQQWHAARHRGDR